MSRRIQNQKRQNDGLHYATSTPALSTTSGNSLEDNSVNSDDFDIASNGSSSYHYAHSALGDAGQQEKYSTATIGRSSRSLRRNSVHNSEINKGLASISRARSRNRYKSVTDIVQNQTQVDVIPPTVDAISQINNLAHHNNRGSILPESALFQQMPNHSQPVSAPVPILPPKPAKYQQSTPVKGHRYSSASDYYHGHLSYHQESYNNHANGNNVSNYSQNHQPNNSNASQSSEDDFPPLPPSPLLRIPQMMENLNLQQNNNCDNNNGNQIHSSNDNEQTPSIVDHSNELAVAEQEELAPPDLDVTEADIRAIDICYRGHKTQVYVCRALANLYAGPKISPRNSSLGGTNDEWKLLYTGIPVLLLDSGNTKSRTKRQIQILIVEKGTCFMLWRDVVDNLSQYSCDGDGSSGDDSDLFHTMHLSYDHSRKVGLSFDCRDAAKAFLGIVKDLTSDPANISLNGPGGENSEESSGNNFERSRSKRRIQSRRGKSLARSKSTISTSLARLRHLNSSGGGDNKKKAVPKKAEISNPCGFQHVVKVGVEDCEKYFSVQAFVDNPGANNNTLSRRNSSVSLYYNKHEKLPRQPFIYEQQQRQQMQQQKRGGDQQDQQNRLSVYNFTNCEELIHI